MIKERQRRRDRRRRRSDETNSLQARAPMDASPQLSEPHDTPEQDRRIARIDLIFGTVASAIGFAWLVTRSMESLEWAAPYLLVVFWLAMLIGGAFAVWANRGKIQRAIEESDFL